MEGWVIHESAASGVEPGPVESEVNVLLFGHQLSELIGIITTNMALFYCIVVEM